MRGEESDVLILITNLVALLRCFGVIHALAEVVLTRADENFVKLGSGGVKEGHTGLSGDGFSKERLSHSGFADEKDAVRHFPAERGKAVGIAQEFHDIQQLVFGLVNAFYVVECDRDILC